MWFVVAIIGLIIVLWIIIKQGDNTKKKVTENNHYTFNIVGEKSYQNNLKKIAGPKVEQSKFFECMAKVSSEPHNKFDKNAIKVEINGLLVGYLSKTDALQLSGKKINKLVPAVIDGGWDDADSEGHYGVKLAINHIMDLNQ